MVQLKGGETCIADESGEQQGLAGGGGRVFRALGHAFGFRTFIPKEEKSQLASVIVMAPILVIAMGGTITQSFTKAGLCKNRVEGSFEYCEVVVVPSVVPFV